MAGHDWKRVTLPEGFLGSVTDMLKFRWLPPNPDLSKCKVWQCQACGRLIAAHGLMSLSDARRRAKVETDCTVEIVKSVHDF